MSTAPSEAEVIFNRANIALVRSQKLIASWLPPATDDDHGHSKTEEELQREEDEIFTAVPERQVFNCNLLGLGAPIPKNEADGSIRRTELSSNDKLKKHLLGKNFRKFETTKPGSPATRSRQPAQASTSGRNAEMVDDSDEDEGRSSLGKSLNKGNSKPTDAYSTKVKRHGSYLDEVLSQKKRKKEKK
ncbi:hypothetical protein FQN57_001431 [Myotisia sp. PD_48]|nr:hypothetical protein FQN57_001431 [Myotisia sp. PD_48]